MKPQLHLLTLIVAVLSAGGILFLNLHVRESVSFGSEGEGQQNDYFGWPLFACERHITYHMIPRGGPQNTTDYQEIVDTSSYFLDYPLSRSVAKHTTLFEASGISPWWRSPFLIDLIAFTAIVGGSTGVCEYIHLWLNRVKR